MPSSMILLHDSVFHINVEGFLGGRGLFCQDTLIYYYII